MLIVDELSLGMIVFECKVEHSFPDVPFSSLDIFFLLCLCLVLGVYVMFNLWLRVVHVTSLALGSVRVGNGSSGFV